MKSLVIIFFIILFVNGKAQNFLMVADTVYNFEIGIPEDWRYTRNAVTQSRLVAEPKGDGAIRCFPTKSNPGFTIDILDFPGMNQAEIREVIERFILEEVEGKGESSLKVLDHGIKLVNGNKFQWELSKMPRTYPLKTIIASTFFVSRDEDALVVTMMAEEEDFLQVEPIFDRIIGTLSY